MECCHGYRYIFHDPDNCHDDSKEFKRENDGISIINQENDVKHRSNRYCEKECLWGLSPIQTYSISFDYEDTKNNQSNKDEKKNNVEQRCNQRCNVLSMKSAVSPLLSVPLNSDRDIFLNTNNLLKSFKNSRIKDFETLMYWIGYLPKHSDYTIHHDDNIEEFTFYEICKSHDVEYSGIILGSIAKHCIPVEVCGYKILVQGDIVEVALSSSAVAEYLGTCTLGAMMCHISDLLYTLEFLGTPNLSDTELHGAPTTLLLVDTRSTVTNKIFSRMNKYIVRIGYFLRRGVKDGLFNLSQLVCAHKLKFLIQLKDTNWTQFGIDNRCQKRGNEYLVDILVILFYIINYK